jgi:long-chain fatty acid transport protein
LSGRTAYKWESFFGVITVSPAVAFKLTDTLTLGATANIEYGILKLDKPALGQYHENSHGMALGATLGLLFKPIEQFSIGLTYRTPIKATLKGTAEMSGAPLMGLLASDDSSRDTKLPMWLAAGIAIKPTDRLTFTADAQYTNWKKLDVIKMVYTDPGWIRYIQPGSDLYLNWKDATQIRFGLEYKVSNSFALRGGFYHDPLVSPKSTQNILLPEIGYNWVTFGFGYKTAKMTIDVSCEYGMGKDVEVGLTEGTMPGTHGMKVLVPNLGFTFNF